LPPGLRFIPPEFPGRGPSPLVEGGGTGTGAGGVTGAAGASSTSELPHPARKLPARDRPRAESASLRVHERVKVLPPRGKTPEEREHGQHQQKK
jgi:hypothetical protein